jgi:hypothetical protein
MKERLKKAQKLRNEGLEWRKAANAIDTTVGPMQSAQFHAAADSYEASAQELMENVPACQVVSGEVVPTEAERPDGSGGWAIRNTLANPDAAAIAASLERSELLTETYTDVLALGTDAAQSIDGANSLEKMLAHQMALAHKSTFRLAGMAMEQRDPVETARLINASARMMSAYQSGLLTLHRLRTGGKQTVTVQHVNVTGGQAVVAGQFQTGGRRLNSEGNKD